MNGSRCLAEGNGSECNGVAESQGARVYPLAPQAGLDHDGPGRRGSDENDCGGSPIVATGGLACRHQPTGGPPVATTCGLPGLFVHCLSDQLSVTGARSSRMYMGRPPPLLNVWAGSIPTA